MVGYHIVTDNVNESPFVDSPPQRRVPLNAVGISNGCDPVMLRQLVCNELMGFGKTEAVAKEWGVVAAEFEQVWMRSKATLGRMLWPSSPI